MKPPVDVGPVNVTGHLRASRARVVWSEGTLYVVHSASRIQKATSDQPVLEGQVWRAQSEDGLISFTRKGCSACGYQLGRIPVDQILNGAT